MFDWLKPVFGRFGAAAKLPPVAVPKVKPNQQSLPSFLRQANPPDTTSLPRNDRRLISTDLTSFKQAPSSRQVIRNFTAASPDLSSAVSALLRTALTAKYKIKARNMDGSFNAEATSLAYEIASRFDRVNNYDDGFSGIWSLQSCSEALGKEIIMYGSLACELVLDKSRLPRSIVPVSVRDIEFRPDNQWTKPVQNIGGQLYDLDLPTFFYVSLDQDLKEAYSDSPIEAALQPVLSDMDFTNDLRRILKRAIHPRLDVTIDMEKFKKNIPSEFLYDPQRLSDYMTETIAAVEATVNALNPEDALVHFDFITVEYKNNGGSDLSGEYEVLQKIIDSKVATGAKALPSILGHGNGNQNAASTDTLLFTKNADGIVRLKLNEVYSKLFTLAVRLFGQDVYVEFEYDEIDLRPKSELEAFAAMKQSRVLELLSLGFISDEEAAIELTGRLPSGNLAPLSGTLFKGGAGVNPLNNPYSNTGAGGNGGGALNEKLKPDTPQQPKGAPKTAAMDFNLMAVNRTLDHAVEGTNTLAEKLVDSHKDVIGLMRDQTYVLAQQTQKPVQVQVESAPLELNLSLEQKTGKKKRRIEMVRDADGYVTAANVVEEDEVDS